MYAFACASRLRAPRRDHEETIAGEAEALPATNRSRCSRARGFHHCEPAPAPLHLPSLPGGRAGRLDPRAPKGRGPCAAHRLLQSKQPASTTTGSSDPRFTEHPRACACALHPTRPLSRSGTGASTLPPACARNLAFSPWNRGFRLVAEAFASKLGHRWHRVAFLRRASRDLATPSVTRKERCDRQPRFHGPGADGFRRRRLRHELPGGRYARELRPNPIRSDTSCRGIAAPPEGDSGLACDPTEGRITRASAKKSGIRRTRGAFHR